jgi:hypothetical protein
MQNVKEIIHACSTSTDANVSIMPLCFQGMPEVQFITRHLVLSGEELLINYGPRYGWDSLGGFRELRTKRKDSVPKPERRIERGRGFANLLQHGWQIPRQINSVHKVVCKTR